MKDKTRALIWGTLLLSTLALSPLRLVKVTGRSMEPTLHDGSTYLLDQFYWKTTGLRRMDIVVLQRGDEQWIKRVVGLPGDRLQLVWTENGLVQQVRNLVHGAAPPVPGTRIEERQVGPGEIFIVGDNLNHSADSTTQGAGAFRLKNIMGVVRTFSFNRTILPAKSSTAQSDSFH